MRYVVLSNEQRAYSGCRGRGRSSHVGAQAAAAAAHRCVVFARASLRTGVIVARGARRRVQSAALALCACVSFGNVIDLNRRPLAVVVYLYLPMTAHTHTAVGPFIHSFNYYSFIAAIISDHIRSDRIGSVQSGSVRLNAAQIRSIRIKSDLI